MDQLRIYRTSLPGKPTTYHESFIVDEYIAKRRTEATNREFEFAMGLRKCVLVWIIVVIVAGVIGLGAFITHRHWLAILNFLF